jgi:hypothetical protein
MDKEIDRCRLCVLPKSDFFGFDDDGTCRLCNAARRTSTVSRDVEGLQERLEKYIQRIKERGRRRPFDCIVGISGGRDSSYLLYLLTHKHHLRCLSAYYRTPFTSNVTDANVRRLTDKLNVPLVEIDVSKELHRRIAKELTILWTEKPHPVIANMACAPCKLVNREIFKIARANSIKAVIYGGSRFEALQISSGVSRGATLTTNVMAAKQLRLVAQLQTSLLLMKRGVEALRISNKLWKYFPLGFQASVMYISLHTPYFRFRYPDILALDYFYFSEWEETECEKALMELGWELPPGCKSSWKSDCSFVELKNYMFRKMTGMTYMDAYMSNMVRAGTLSREEALRRIKVEGTISAERLSEVCEILELPNELSTLFKQEAS